MLSCFVLKTALLLLLKILVMCICLQEMLQAGLIVAGYDSREGGQVYAVPLGGTLVKVPFSIGGQSHLLPYTSLRGS